MLILDCSDVQKKYSNNNFELTIDRLKVTKGKNTLILGPNGSGKTTFLKLILNLINLENGFIKVLGKKTDNDDARKPIAYLPEKLIYPVNFTVYQVLFYFECISRRDYKNIHRQINHLAKLFRVDYLEKKVKHLSKGMLQTVGLMSIFLESKDFYILDEPFSGLDAVQKKIIIDYIEDELADSTFLITTHVTQDVESIYDQVYSIQNGGVLDMKSQSEIVKSFDSLNTYYLSIFA